MVSDAKKKRAALKAAKGRGSSKSLASSGDGGLTPNGGSSATLDSLVAQVGSASLDDGGERSVTSVLTSHPQVRDSAALWT